MTIGGWNPGNSWSCAVCAWLSPCRTKCFNPHYIVMCGHNSLPIMPEMYGCYRYENKETRLKDNENLAILASQSFTNPT